MYSISCDQLIKQFNSERTCLFFINEIVFYSLEAGNCVSDSSFKWMKNTHKQFSSTPKVNRLSAQSYSSDTVGFQSWTNVSVVVPASYRRCADTPLSLASASLPCLISILHPDRKLDQSRGQDRSRSSGRRIISVQPEINHPICLFVQHPRRTKKSKRSRQPRSFLVRIPLMWIAALLSLLNRNMNCLACLGEHILNLNYFIIYYW